MGDRTWKQEAKTNHSTKEVQGQGVFEYSAMVGSRWKTAFQSTQRKSGLSDKYQLSYIACQQP